MTHPAGCVLCSVRVLIDPFASRYRTRKGQISNEDTGINEVAAKIRGGRGGDVRPAGTWKEPGRSMLGAQAQLERRLYQR